MTFKEFKYSGKFWPKFWIFLRYKLGFIYLANTAAKVPYYIQQISKKHWKHLKEGTKCYLSEFDVMLELRENGRWFALGDSYNARQLNGEVEAWVKIAEETTANQIFEEIKKFTRAGSDALEAKILADEAALVKPRDPKLNN